MTKIAFLGLGAMGSRMAANLIKAGHSVTVWNRTAAKAEALANLGAAIAGSPAAAASGAEIVISMVTDDTSARAVWLDANTGAVNALGSSSIAIECSTVTPAWVKELATAVSNRGAGFLDAPVAGSRPHAEGGQLVFMVGGSPEAVEKARPVLEPMAANILHVGNVGQGAVLKLAVNTLFAAQLESVAELLGFLSRSGFEVNEAANLLGQFPIVAPPIAGAAKMMAAGNIAPLFTIDLIEKDLGYILDSATMCGAYLPGASATQAAFQAAQAKGLGDANVSGLAKVFALRE
jgi:3-hydroxyisobutyrate dehydrogenase